MKTWLFSLLLCFVSITLFSQEKNDTLIFQSKFGFLTKSIEIIDSCNGASIKLNSKDGRLRTPKEFIINKNTKVIKVIIIRYPLIFRKKIVGYLKIEDVGKKVINIWDQNGVLEYQFFDSIPPKIY